MPNKKNPYSDMFTEDLHKNTAITPKETFLPVYADIIPQSKTTEYAEISRTNVTYTDIPQSKVTEYAEISRPNTTYTDIIQLKSEGNFHAYEIVGESIVGESVSKNLNHYDEIDSYDSR